MRLRYCVNGHDTFACGRYPNSCCKECHRERCRARRPVRMKLPPLPVRFDFAPLEAAMRSHGMTLSGVSGRQLMRYRTEGVRWWTVDRICVAMGMFPSDVYGRAWFGETG